MYINGERPKNVAAQERWKGDQPTMDILGRKACHFSSFSLSSFIYFFPFFPFENNMPKLIYVSYIQSIAPREGEERVMSGFISE